MNINFKTKFPWLDMEGQAIPTHFVEKVLACVEYPNDPQTWTRKLHTIRRLRTSKGRFRAGMPIKMQIGSRFKPQLFATTTCTGSQILHMRVVWDTPLSPSLLDGNTSLTAKLHVHLLNKEGKVSLITAGTLYTMAMHDGFSETGAFLRWFMLDVLTHGEGYYELVHWTDLRY